MTSFQTDQQPTAAFDQLDLLMSIFKKMHEDSSTFYWAMFTRKHMVLLGVALITVLLILACQYIETAWGNKEDEALKPTPWWFHCYIFIFMSACVLGPEMIEILTHIHVNPLGVDKSYVTWRIIGACIVSLVMAVSVSLYKRLRKWKSFVGISIIGTWGVMALYAALYVDRMVLISLPVFLVAGIIISGLFGLLGMMNYCLITGLTTIRRKDKSKGYKLE